MALPFQRLYNWLGCRDMTGAVASSSLGDCNMLVQWVMGTFSQTSSMDGFIGEIPAAVKVMV